MSRNKKRGVNLCQAYNFRPWAIYDGFPVAEVDEVGKVGVISYNGFPVGFRWVSSGFPWAHMAAKAQKAAVSHGRKIPFADAVWCRYDLGMQSLSTIRH